MSEKVWVVYMLRCADDSLYTGITTDVERRVKQHNGELNGGAKYTSARRPVTMEWQEQHPSRSEATRRELAIKSMSRADKTLLITS